MVDVKILYESYELLSKAGENAGEHEDEFKTLIKGCDGDEQCKRLAAQFLPTFIKFFPAYCEEALDKCLDMCEDTDINVRHESVKNLIRFTSHSENVLIRVSDVLIQLCLADDEKMLTICREALMKLAETYASGIISACFLHIDESIDSSQVIGANLLQYVVKIQLKQKQTNKVLLTEVFNKISTSIKQMKINGESSSMKSALLTLLGILHSLSVWPSFLESFVESVSIVLIKLYPKLLTIDDCAYVIRILNQAKSFIQKDKYLLHFITDNYVVVYLISFLESVFNKSIKDYVDDSALKKTFQILLQDLFSICLYVDRESAEKLFFPFAFLLKKFIPLKEDFNQDSNCYTMVIDIELEYLHILILFFYLFCCKNDSLLTNDLFVEIKQNLSILSRVINAGNLKKTATVAEKIEELPKKRHIITAPEGAPSAKAGKRINAASNKISNRENDIVAIIKNLHCTPPELSMISPSWRFDLGLSKLRTDIINWIPESSGKRLSSITTFDENSALVKKVRRTHAMSGLKSLRTPNGGAEIKKSSDPVV